MRSFGLAPTQLKPTLCRLIPTPHNGRTLTTWKLKPSPPNAAIDPATGVRPPINVVVEQTHVFEANLQKLLLSEYEQKFKIKSEGYTKFVADKKALITIIFGQYDEVTKTKIALGATYTADRLAGDLIKFIKRLHTVCFGGDDGGLSYGPYKQVVAVKSINNYTNNEPYDTHGFKEQVKIKFEATKVIVGRFPNGTTALTELLSKAQPIALDWAAYCALPVNKQLVWEVRADELNQAMFFLMNLKNQTTKEDLRLTYSQENSTVYPIKIKAMARYLSTQYSNNKPTNQRRGKKGD